MGEYWQGLRNVSKKFIKNSFIIKRYHVFKNALKVSEIKIYFFLTRAEQPCQLNILRETYVTRHYLLIRKLIRNGYVYKQLN